MLPPTTPHVQRRSANTATDYGRQHGITVIDGGCPLMFNPIADLGYKAMRFVFTRTGKVPKQV